jgi:DNA-binding response OmpR family regulator
MALILVIDDHLSTCVLIQQICKLRDIECISASTAETGLRLAQEVKPGLIFVDLALPGKLLGWQAISFIKNDTSLRDSVVIAMTAGDHHDSAMEAGSDGYLRKPFHVQQVIDHLEKHVR